MLALAKTIRDKRPTIDPPPEIRREIKQLGSIEAWVNLTGTRRKLFRETMAKVAPGMSKQGEIKIAVKLREWPDDLQSTVKGYERQQMNIYSTRPVPLSAGTPGNEETDPGPQSSD